MKRVLFLSLWLIGVLVFAIPAHAQTLNEHIEHFTVSAAIQQSGTVKITESIDYVFADATHHGIYRDIPTNYKTEVGNRSIQISDITVVDEKGIPYRFEVSHASQMLRIRIGDADTLVQGHKIYTLSYTVGGAINYFDSFDEFYWNATGLGWQVPILEASEKITLPKTIEVSQTQASCYEGANGSTEPCTIASSTGVYVFSTTHMLAAAQGLTAALGFPKGIVTEPSMLQRVFQFLKSNAVVGLPIIVFFGMLWWWFKKGKDPQGRGTVVPEYDSPDNLTPLQLYAIMHERSSNNAISAEFLYLATEGYLTITKIHEKKLFLDHTDYELQKLKEGSTLPEHSKALLDGLFASGNAVKLSELKNIFYTKIPKIKKSVITSVLEKKYFSQDPAKIRSLYAGIGIACIVLVFFISSSISPVTIVSVIAAGLIVALFGLIMPKITKEGAVVREKILGLKMYMDVAEKERIKFHNAPEKNPTLFEKLLPFAMVLGVESAWAKQFVGLYTQNPSWYHDTSGGVFNLIFFTQDLHSFSTVASSTLASAPGGGSGSGGGGFSGGGMGGGGGGSW